MGGLHYCSLTFNILPIPGIYALFPFTFFQLASIPVTQISVLLFVDIFLLLVANQVYGSWTPFKQYSENSHSHQESFLHRTSFESRQRHILLNREQASSIIKRVFPVGSDTCTNCCHERQKVLGIKLQSVLGLTDVNEIDDLQFARGSPRTLWSSLMVSSSKKQRVKQKSTRWKKTYMGQLWHCFEQGQYDGVLSDSEESEETDESSVEGEMMMEQSSYKFLLNNINGLYISQHGLVFESKDEVWYFEINT